MYLLNLTLHEPTQEMERVADISPPEGEHFSPSDTGYDISQIAEEKVKKAADQNADGILIGGLSSFSGYVMYYAWRYNVDVYEVVGTRQRDGQDNFRFNFQGFRHLSQPAGGSA